MKLYAHQKEIIAADPKKTGLFLGTGSGKTRTALALAEGTTLVIAPKTQVEDQNWIREFRQMRLDGRKGLPPLPVVISKETFRRDHYKLPKFDTVIVDEAHTMLGVTPTVRYLKRVAYPKTSQLFEALETYLARAKPKRLYLCTATIMKSPFTVWAAMRILGKVQESSFYAFRDQFYTRLPMPGREVWSPKKDSQSKNDLAHLVRGIGFVGRLEDYFDVPDQTFKTDFIELTAEQKKRIKELRTEYPDPIVRIGKQHQVENGVLAGDEFSKPQEFKNAKIEKILEYAEEFPRMVVFAKYTAQIVAIQEALSKSGVMTWRLNGETKDRGAVIAAAGRNEGVLICQAQISAGWELPEYPVMIFASRTYSFVDYDQALGRIQRANNIKKNLYINLVVKGGVDEAVDTALGHKSDFNERLYSGI